MRSSRSIKLSKRETELLGCIPEDGSRVSTKAIVAAYYGRDVPMNGRQIITDRLSKIILKLSELPGYDFKLCKSQRRGPAPIEYWRAKVG